MGGRYDARIRTFVPTGKGSPALGLASRAKSDRYLGRNDDAVITLNKQANVSFLLEHTHKNRTRQPVSFFFFFSFVVRVCFCSLVAYNATTPALVRTYTFMHSTHK